MKMCDIQLCLKLKPKMVSNINRWLIIAMQGDTRTGDGVYSRQKFS